MWNGSATAPLRHSTESKSAMILVSPRHRYVALLPNTSREVLIHHDRDARPGLSARLFPVAGCRLEVWLGRLHIVA
jgi:hypothetical protein